MRIRGASLWAGIISGGIAQFQDTRALQNGQMSKSDYAIRTTKNVTGAVGIMAGIEYGAIIGTRIMPGIGTIAGTIIGGMIGDRLGSMVGQQAGHAIFHNRVLNVESPNLMMSDPTVQYHELEENPQFLQ